MLCAGVSVSGRMISGFPVSVLTVCRLNWLEVVRSASAAVGAVGQVLGLVQAFPVVSVVIISGRFRGVSGASAGFPWVSCRWLSTCSRSQPGFIGVWLVTIILYNWRKMDCLRYW